LPNQRKKGKRLIGYYEWETNADELRRIADEKGISLSELLKELSETLLSKNGKKYKGHEYE
jgi:hypothetical protein